MNAVAVRHRGQLHVLRSFWAVNPPFRFGRGLQRMSSSTPRCRTSSTTTQISLRQARLGSAHVSSDDIEPPDQREAHAVVHPFPTSADCAPIGRALDDVPLACRLFTLRSWNINPLATTYESPAKICVYKYSREEADRRSLSAMPSETR